MNSEWLSSQRLDAVPLSGTIKRCSAYRRAPVAISVGELRIGRRVERQRYRVAGKRRAQDLQFRHYPMRFGTMIRERKCGIFGLAGRSRDEVTVWRERRTLQRPASRTVSIGIGDHVAMCTASQQSRSGPDPVAVGGGEQVYTAVRF